MLHRSNKKVRFVDEFGRDPLLRKPKKEEINPCKTVEFADEFVNPHDNEPMVVPVAECVFESALVLNTKAPEVSCSNPIFKGISWAELTWMLEEEEERQLKIIDDERKELYENNLYELEEGELFE